MEAIQRAALNTILRMLVFQYLLNSLIQGWIIILRYKRNPGTYSLTVKFLFEYKQISRHYKAFSIVIHVEKFFLSNS